jgi:hypothetical protein
MDKTTKYRRPFDWRIGHGNVTNATASAAFARLFTSDYPALLEDLLEMSRRRRQNRIVLAKLQVWMLEELLVQESAVKHYREKKESLQKQPPDQPLDEIKKQLAFVEEQLFFHRAYANCIRIIGDGIAWRSLGYDRLVMKSLAGSATKPHVSSEGTVQEMREWSLQFDSGQGVAILNSLTNCLAIGDVTVVKNDGTVEIVEVKAGNTKSSRIVRQKQKMRDVVTFLSSGSGVIEGKFVEVERLDIVPENGLSELEELLKESETNGWAAKRISNCLYVECVDFRKAASAESINPLLDEKKNTEIGDWKERGDIVMVMSSLDLLSYAPNCAPFSIFPFDPGICVGLMVGAQSYAVSFNFTAVQREFQYRGWSIEKSFEEQMEAEEKESMLVVKKDGHEVHVPPEELIRVWMELMRVSVVIKLCEFRKGPTNEGYSYTVYDGEPAIWD